MSNQTPNLLPIWMKYHLVIVLLSIAMICSSGVFYFIAPALFDIPLIIVIVIGGIPLFIEIIYDLFKGNLGADILAIIALVTAVVLHQYFAAVMIILMLASGQTLELFAMRKASSVLSALVERMPNVAHRKINDTIEDISLSEIQIGDRIVIYPHETCPVDGVIIDGQGSMDEAYLTGEPYQISKAPGSFVLSGAINGEVVLIVKAEKLPSDSRYASIVSVLKETQQKRPNIRRLGDQIGAWFAPVALIFALLIWLYTGEAIRFLAVLVIATPCPLLIAIPITIISAISMAASRAIIIKDPIVLERLPVCRTAIFDKTGTLTYGKPKLTEIFTTEQYNEDFILQCAASLERYSKHPLSGAIINAAKLKKLKLLSVEKIVEKPGKGLVGNINQDTIMITHRKFILDHYPDLMHQLPSVSTGLECIILHNNQYAATLKFKDIPRMESHSFISHLEPTHQFNKIMLVSGDRQEEVADLGAALDLTHVYAGQTPEQKLKIVEEERKKNPTLFMGDGINDALALSAATVGIAFGQNSNITAAAAGAVIMDSSLTKVDELIHLSLATRRIALQSAVGGMILSLIGMGFAAFGFISPIAGSILQELIDIVAIANALRLIFMDQVKADF